MVSVTLNKLFPRKRRFLPAIQYGSLPHELTWMGFSGITKRFGACLCGGNAAFWISGSDTLLILYKLLTKE